MPQFFAFLRAINASPGRVVKMNVLRQTFESLGFSGVATLLGSRNVVFETRAKDVGILERILRLESEMFKLRSRLNILEARNQHNQPITAGTKSNLDLKWLSREICRRLGVAGH